MPYIDVDNPGPDDPTTKAALGVLIALRPEIAAQVGRVAAPSVASITVSLSEELAKEGIWVNAVVPSTMDTPANRKAMPKADYSTWAKVEAVAATVAFLASPQNGVTRGGLVPVYGKA